ncbi:MAG: hypothetical protein R6U27_08935 [Desulfobacterales bacterium]
MPGYVRTNPHLRSRITYYQSWASDYIAARTIDRSAIDGVRYNITRLDFLTLRFDIENLTDEDEYFEEGVLYYSSIRFDF